MILQIAPMDAMITVMAVSAIPSYDEENDKIIL